MIDVSTGVGKFIKGMGGPGAVLGLGASLIGGFLGAGQARRARRRAQKEANRLQNKLSNLEANRQAIIDPYAGITDLSSMATDRSDLMTNQFANLSVATQAAEMQIEQADISLANTLDTLMATGSGAGGATALAMAALKSKQGISANLEQQEVANEKLKAQGAMEVSKLMAEGKKFMFQAQEERDMMDLDRTAAMIDQERANEAAAAQAEQAAYGQIGSGAISGFTNILGTL